jgi:hypothetical protein
LFQLIILISLSQSTYSQGISCGTAFLLNLNGNITNYPTASSTGTSVVCTAYTGTTPVTWFRFITNASPQCPLINITASDGQQCEVAMYSSCNGQNLEATSSMCLADGSGLWAPNETFVLSANTTYYLRIKTSTICTISIGGQFITPTNNICSGATSITTSPITDNNACHKGSTEVLPDQLCAFTLENTAFYKFIIASQGSAIMNISNISCDNGEGNNASGFQIGFFTGSCGNLIPLNCQNGSGSFVQATTNPLPAGSLVFVAIDGVSGSNCIYTLTGINVYGVLSQNFKNFSGWKKDARNMITWTCLNDNGAYYVIERSINGKEFQAIGQIPKPAGETQKVDYSFEDNYPLEQAWYRIRQIDQTGTISLSHGIRVVRQDITNFTIKILKTSKDKLELYINSKENGKLHYIIMGSAGEMVSEGILNYASGITNTKIQTNNLAGGQYFIRINNGNDQPIVLNSFLVAF